jgi:hypothetical protein
MARRAQSFRATPRNMVQEVTNIVEGYRMGPLRALAQDPPQNSYDARRSGVRGPVEVAYRLYERQFPSGDTMHLLTVTDRNTTGLRGPALTPEQLFERAQETGYLQLGAEENWAAWEAMGYTKLGEDQLGSRGQGKAAFLFHSSHPTGLVGAGGQPLERMIIFYDTLLPDGTYRLGVRLARPDDVVLSPPYVGGSARSIVRGSWAGPGWEGPPIPLRLEPLEQVGTRIIVPFLSDEAVEALQTGELVRWLQRSWWRAIQVGDLSITVRVGNRATEVQVPDWWADEPWNTRPLPPNVLLKENIQLEPGSSLRIKRIVLLHDPDVEADEIDGWPTQFSGIQLLRRHQWIETLGAWERFADFIPADKRAGFRGFVEFDRRLDQELRKVGVESPQHDAFIRRRTFVQQIDLHLRSAVREFAETQGWLASEVETPHEDETAEEILQAITELFVADGIRGRRRRRPREIWTCELDVDFPRADTTRIEWGEVLKNVAISCTHHPSGDRRDVIFRLSVVGPDGVRKEVATRSRKSKDGRATATFGDFTVSKVVRASQTLKCPDPGRYRLVGETLFEGVVVASDSRHMYVRANPPVRKTRQFSVDVEVSNVSAERTRINDGEAIGITVRVASRAPQDAKLAVNVSLGELLLADASPVELQGRAEGDAPSSATLAFPKVAVHTKRPDPEPEDYFVVLAPGKHYVRVDVLDGDGQVVAHAARAVFVEVDPDESDVSSPFEVRMREEPNVAYPLWELDPPHGDTNRWILWCARHHPAYHAAELAERARPDGRRLYGLDYFWAEVECGALMEWAMRLYRSEGDEGPFRLLAERPEHADDSLWEQYQMRVQDLIQVSDDPVEFSALLRKAVSLMVYLTEEALA